MRFTPAELRQAVEALAVIERDGDPDQWALILGEAHRSAPAAGRWGNATGNQHLGGMMLAHRVAELLGVPRDCCEQAAADLFAPQYHRAVFEALLSYAGELTGKGSRLPKSSKAVGAVRIVPDQEAVA
jgi:hypothetical protein